MRTPGVEAGLARIASDRESGALELALAAIDVMADAGDLPRRELEAVADALAAAQPGMAAVRNAAYSCVYQRGEADLGRVNYRDALKAFRRFVETSRPRAGRQLAKVVSQPAAVATLSWSSTVLEALRLLRGRRVLTRVAVLESLPGGEGKRTAAALSGEGIAAVWVRDDAVVETVNDCDLVLLGADTLLRDGGIVNKVRSRDLAAAARAAGKRVLVVAETIKLDVHHDAADAPVPGRFEVVPAALLTSVATERGVLPPSRLAELAAQ
jgi:translation initiation factor eIF-2B subunit delta